jgi:predicted metalloprotease
MTFRDDVKLDTSQVSDMRGRSLGRTGMVVGGGGGSLLVVIVLIVLNLMAGGTGANPLAGLEGLQVGATGDLSSCKTGADANANDACRIVGYVDSIQAYWTSALPAAGWNYQKSNTVFFSGNLDTDCGMASSDSGPFYCPGDQLVYIDLGFFGQLQSQFGAKGGPFAEAYILAHEYGHHVQDIAGILNDASRQEGAQGGSVRVELQADCLAGVWANNAVGTGYLVPITNEEVSQALDAAASVGDDRIQQSMQGYVNPESWTHGSSAQRSHWFTVGYQEGSYRSCDTFSGSI